MADAAEVSGKTVVAVMLGRDEGPLTPTSSLPVFAFAEPAVDALGRAVAYATWRARPEGSVPTFENIHQSSAAALADDALSASPAGTALALVTAAKLLGCYGIAVPPSTVVANVEEAVAAAAAIGYPVVLKAVAAPVVIRSESGGVALDIQSEDELRGSYERMAVAFGHGMNPAVVQAMVAGGVEVILTASSHPSFGPVVSFGLGGAFADAIGDRATRAVPLTDLDAAEMIASSRGAVALDLIGADRDALIEMVLRLGRLIDEVPAVSSVRLNPVLVSRRAAWA